LSYHNHSNGFGGRQDFSGDEGGGGYNQADYGFNGQQQRNNQFVPRNTDPGVYEPEVRVAR
jgi:hypothetical protein